MAYYPIHESSSYKSSRDSAACSYAGQRKQTTGNFADKPIPLNHAKKG